MIELALNGVKKYFGGNKVFENITFEVKTGERVGLIGRNGTGKTTIFKIISGIEKQDEGNVSVRKNASIGYLEQIADYPMEFTVADVLKTAFKEQYEILEQLNSLEKKMAGMEGQELERILKRYADLNELYELKEGYYTEEKLSKVCVGLKFDEEFLEEDFMSLSGGEKTIVLLGKILLQGPDILLLDEPSNHLDMASMEWLEDYLKTYKGTVLVISHDRYFLDRVATKIVEIDWGEISSYEGNYSYYVDEKQKRLLEEFEAYNDQQKKIKAMEKAIKQLREWAKQGDNEKFFKRAASMQKRLDKIQRLDRPVLEAPKIKLDFGETDRSGKDVIMLEAVSKSFENAKILENVNLELVYGQCTALIGRNGSGKSTMIKLILGELRPDCGEISLGSNIKIGYLPQNVAFKNENLSVVDTFREDLVISEGEARKILAKFLFYGESVFKTVKNLSGGEKSRLKLCKLVQQDINFLILDEPTNHLDIDSREMLEEALEEFKGTILFVSHDRFFINKLAGRVCEIKDMNIISYDGNYEYYKTKDQEAKMKDMADNKAKEKVLKKASNTNKKFVDNIGAGKKEAGKIENLIKELETRLKTIDEEINNISDVTDYNKLAELSNKKLKIQEDIDSNLEKWMKLSASE